MNDIPTFRQCVAAAFKDMGLNHPEGVFLTHPSDITGEPVECRFVFGLMCRATLEHNAAWKRICGRHRLVYELTFLWDANHRNCLATTNSLRALHDGDAHG